MPRENINTGHVESKVWAGAYPSLSAVFWRRRGLKKYWLSRSYLETPIIVLSRLAPVELHNQVKRPYRWRQQFWITDNPMDDSWCWQAAEGLSWTSVSYFKKPPFAGHYLSILISCGDEMLLWLNNWWVCGPTWTVRCGPMVDSSTKLAVIPC